MGWAIFEIPPLLTRTVQRLDVAVPLLAPPSIHNLMKSNQGFATTEVFALQRIVFILRPALFVIQWSTEFGI